MTIFNRAEAALTFDMDEQARIRGILAENGIEYTVRTINRRSPSRLSSGSRGYTGSFGEKPELQYQYLIYVKRDDLERARRLIGYK